MIDQVSKQDGYAQSARLQAEIGAAARKERETARAKK